jgi:hypothetical protein
MEVSFSVIRHYVSQVEQFVDSMKIAYQSLKLAIKPSAAVAPAVVLYCTIANSKKYWKVGQVLFWRAEMRTLEAQRR